MAAVPAVTPSPPAAPSPSQVSAQGHPRTQGWFQKLGTAPAMALGGQAGVIAPIAVFIPHQGGVKWHPANLRAGWWLARDPDKAVVSLGIVFRWGERHRRCHGLGSALVSAMRMSLHQG